MSKLKAGETAVRVTEHAVQILGGYGYIRDFPVEKWSRDAKIYDDLRGHLADAAPGHRAPAPRGLTRSAPFLPQVPGSPSRWDKVLGQGFPGVLAAARAGTGWALERLWEELGPLLAGYLRLQGVIGADAVASAVGVEVFRALPRFSGDEAALRWFALMATHRRLRELRRDAEGRPDPAEVQGVPPALAALPDGERDVLLLRILGPLSIEQVASTLGTRPSAVRPLQRRGLASLRADGWSPSLGGATR